MRGSLAVCLFGIISLLVPAVSAAPEQVHLGIVNSDPSTGLAVNWRESAPVSDAHVVVDLPEGPKRFPAQSIEGPTPGIVYEAHINGLAPGTTYAYHIGERSFTLTTAGAKLDDEHPFTFAALGDMGATENSALVANAIHAADPAFILLAGDISYADGDPTIWDRCFELVEPLAARRPLLPVLGNHETYSHMGTGLAGYIAHGFVASPIEQAFFTQRFPLPNNEFWYSFDWQGVHVIGLTTYGQNLDGDAPLPPAEQLAWLENDLRTRKNTPWTVVFFHEAPYTSVTDSIDTKRNLSSPRVQNSFVPLFDKYGVDVVVLGHLHVYERSFPLSGGVPTTTELNGYNQGNGIVYITTGGGGESLTCQWEEQRPNWMATRGCAYEFLRFDVTRTKLSVTAVHVAGDPLEDAFSITAATTPASTPNAVGASAPLLTLVALVLVAFRRR